VENAVGPGHLIAQQLLGAGEAVLDEAPKLAAKGRLLSDGDTNKNDLNDARSGGGGRAALGQGSAAVREDYSAVMGMWSDRYLELAAARTQVVCRLHALFCELIPARLVSWIGAPSRSEARRRRRARNVTASVR
jgi:transposase